MSEQKSYVRFSKAQRIEHAVLIASFTILAITGLVQKYSSNALSEGLILIMGGIQGTRVIHRIAATVFLLEAIYHIVVVGYKLFVLRVAPTMLPGVKDATDAIQSVTYNLGVSKKAPRMPRYNFAEKAEYWAMIWGLVLMGLTGLMMWNPIMTANLLPGQFIPAAKIAHGMEALLAVLAIIVWHFYHVHLKNFNKSMFTGKISHHEMVEDHAAELEQIEAGHATRASVSEKDLARRRKIYIPIAAIVAVVLMAGTYWILTAEQTAIETVLPPESDVPVFVPATETPALPQGTAVATETGDTTADTEAGNATSATWNGGFSDLFNTKCGSCHGASAMGGFSVVTYADVTKAITPGDASASSVVTVQQKGGHPGQFTDEELQQVIDWINAGAPEQ